MCRYFRWVLIWLLATVTLAFELPDTQIMDLDDAARSGNADALRLLLSTEHEFENGDLLKAIKIAIKHNHYTVIQTILAMKPVTCNLSSLDLALEDDHSEILSLLIENCGPVYYEIFTLFRKACRIGSLRVVNMLIHHEDIDLAIPLERSFVIVARLNGNNFETSVETHDLILAFKEAAEKGQEAVVRCLLKDGRFEKGARKAIDLALKANRFRIVCLLYAHPAISIFWADLHPNITEMTLSIKACKMNELHCIYQEFSLIPLGELEILCRCALAHGHLQVFDQLLNETMKRTLSEEDIPRWYETADYLIELLSRNRDTARIFRLFNLICPPSHAISAEEYLEALSKTIHWNNDSCLHRVATLLQAYQKHFMLRTFIKEMDVDDIWSEILFFQLAIALFRPC